MPDSSTPYYESEHVVLHLGDCLDVLKAMPDAYVHSVVTDPPYEIGFMGRGWDASGIAYSVELWKQCLRVLKPGGHLLAFGATRTYHRLTVAIEDAGFEIRDSLHWIYGSGFPKGQDVSKQIDKRRDDRAEVLKVTAWLAAAVTAAGWTTRRMNVMFGFKSMAGHWVTQGIGAAVPTLEQWRRLREAMGFDDTEILPLVEMLNGRKGEIGESWSRREIVGEAYRVKRQSAVQITPLSTGAYDVTASATDDARTWEGWNTALKPAHEPIVMARKPMRGTVAANVLDHGTGAINVDGCRVATRSEGPGSTPASSVNGHRNAMAGPLDRMAYDGSAGRWPSNVVFGHSPECIQVGERVMKGDARSGQAKGSRPGGFMDIGSDSGTDQPNGTLHGDQVVPVFECGPGCPVAELDAQSGVLTSGANPSRRSSDKFRTAYGDFAGQPECIPARGADSGGASRFFPVFRYQAKASKRERPVLEDGTQHTTVKPLELMRWLVRLVTPPGGTVLDPFAGSGTTLEAAVLEGFHVIGIELEQKHAELCTVRLGKAQDAPTRRTVRSLDEAMAAVLSASAEHREPPTETDD